MGRLEPSGEMNDRVGPDAGSAQQGDVLVAGEIDLGPLDSVERSDRGRSSPSEPHHVVLAALYPCGVSALLLAS